MKNALQFNPSKGIFDAPLRDADPIERVPLAKKAELDAAKDRAELVMAKDVTQFRHPNDLVTIAIAELGSAPDSLQATPIEV
jgi:hypothetical protein